MRGVSAKRAVVVASLVALACLLFILIAGLNNLELLPGRPLPNLSQSPESERTANRPLATRPSDVSGLVVVLVAGGLAGGIAVSLFFRQLGEQDGIVAAAQQLQPRVKLPPAARNFGDDLLRGRRVIPEVGTLGLRFRLL